MIIIYGTHHYGKVDSHDHQYQLTRFFHLYYIPLLPLSSIWVTARTPTVTSATRPRSRCAAYSPATRASGACSPPPSTWSRAAWPARSWPPPRPRCPALADPYRAAAPLREPGPSEW